MRDYKIVCVDDEELILEIYKSSLEEIGHENEVELIKNEIKKLVNLSHELFS